MWKRSFLFKEELIPQLMFRDDQAKQVAHYEMISGISPHAYILWAPLHDLEDDGGAYHMTLSNLLKLCVKKREMV